MALCPTLPPSTPPTPAPSVDFEVVLELDIPVSSVNPDFSDVLRDILRNFSVPQNITGSLKLKGLNFTTWCDPNSTGGLQCQCEQQFAWSCDKCDEYGACSDVISQTCGCIKGLPPGGEFCQPITSMALCPTLPPSTPPTPAPSVDFEVVLELDIPVSSVNPDFSDVLRDILRNFSVPQNITGSLKLKGLNFTTWCDPNSTGGLQCQCEQQFAWSCDKCDEYGACSDVISQTCGCIKGLPPGGEFCQPITSMALCPTLPPSTPPTPAPSVDFEVVLELDIPVSSVNPDFSDVLRDILRNFSVPQNITGSLKLKGLNFTTWCDPNSTGGLQCQCEQQFAWSCDKCDEYGACSDVISQTCGCIKGLPPGGEFCQPITSMALCPTLPPSTPPTPAPSVDFEVVLELDIPVSSVNPDFSDVLRDILRNFSVPQNITGSLKLKGLNFTTWCDPNSTGGLQCQCEQQFAWSCDKCDEYGACSDVISQTCGCIKGLPPGGEFCQPITSMALCPTLPPSTPPTPAPSVDFEVVLELDIPVSSVNPDFSDVLRDILRNFSLPQNITGSLKLKGLNFTTWCDPNSTGGLQCQCEQQFAWSCDKCDEYGACSDVISQTCGCIKGLPPGGEFCQPITSMALCPTLPPSTPPTPAPSVDFEVVLELDIPVSSVNPDFSDVLRDILRNFSLPQNITGSLKLKGLNFTTWCDPNSTGGLQCQCEQQFAWSCDKCDEYGACSDVISQTCGCIKGLPPGGEFCQPITSMALCPTLPPSTPPTPAPSVDFEVVLELDIPVSSVNPNFSDVLRDILRNISLPQNITGSLKLKGLNFTTWCDPNSTGGLQCQCEQQFAWSCDKCDKYGACSDVISQTCGCIKGLPPGGEFCQPITSMALCPTLPPSTPPTPAPSGMTSIFVHLLAELQFRQSVLWEHLHT
ncbi:uncharacterized protein LOC115774656 [Archocentrus centrarchus]|uniref:uncharacterized protein LOC115774656 n=1 Tax=Archocentrus centrarchus TaxID=63155 RepID=UPI0011EA2F7F|nr:uncharacterized protein LOC115774656 [Archocentrus centrarchus]